MKRFERSRRWKREATTTLQSVYNLVESEALFGHGDIIPSSEEKNSNQWPLCA